MFNYRMWMTPAQVKQAEEIGKHLRVTVRRGLKQKQFRVVVTADPQAEEAASSMVMELTRELLNGLHSIYGIQGELVDVD
jgi:hypothetical protein